MSALVALVNVAAQNGCSAVLDSLQNPLGVGIQQIPVLSLKLFTVDANDIGHLAGRPLHYDSAAFERERMSKGLTVFCTWCWETWR